MGLEQYQNSDLMTCDHTKLVDLQDIRIDRSLPQRSRMISFLKQAGDPYLFKMDGLIIRAVYPPEVKNRLSDAIANLLSR